MANPRPPRSNATSQASVSARVQMQPPVSRILPLNWALLAICCWIAVPCVAADEDLSAMDNATAASFAAALAAEHARSSSGLRAAFAGGKLPGRVDPARAARDEGYFAIIGDWGNPFHPGTGDAADAFWGPHWKCNVNNWGDPVRCQIGSPEWERDEYAQINVATAMTKYARAHEVQFVLNMGDNLYPAGFDSPHDPRWQSVFEQRYADEALQVPWLSVLGNHDFGGFDCYLEDGHLSRADSQIGYDDEHEWEWPQSKRSRWVMPSWNYKKRISFGSTTMDFFIVATNWVNEFQSCGENRLAAHRCDSGQCRACLHNMADVCLHFLQTQLPASDADWKFVVGHRPLDTLSRWLDARVNFVDLLRKNNVSMYIAGHRHTLEEHWLSPKGGAPWFADGPQRPGAVLEVVSGAGGGSYSDGAMPGLSRWGFNGVKVTNSSLEVDYLSDDGRLMRSIRLPPPCAQFQDSKCAWTTGPWSGCSQGRRTRIVLCAKGPEEYCANSPRPEPSESCEEQQAMAAPPRNLLVSPLPGQRKESAALPAAAIPAPVTTQDSFFWDAPEAVGVLQARAMMAAAVAVAMTALAMCIRKLQYPQSKTRVQDDAGGMSLAGRLQGSAMRTEPTAGSASA